MASYKEYAGDGWPGGMSKDPRAGILPDFIFDRESGGAGPGEWSDAGRG